MPTLRRCWKGREKGDSASLSRQPSSSQSSTSSRKPSQTQRSKYNVHVLYIHVTLYVHVHSIVWFIDTVYMYIHVHVYMFVHVHVLLVPWLSGVYGICIMSVVKCIPLGFTLGNTFNCMSGTTHTPLRAIIMVHCEGSDLPIIFFYCTLYVN